MVSKRCHSHESGVGFRQIEELYQSARQANAGARAALAGTSRPGAAARSRAAVVPAHRRRVSRSACNRERVTTAGRFDRGSHRNRIGHRVLAWGHTRSQHKLGEGGMGEVFLATDTRLGRAVAIKTTREQFTPDSSARRELSSALNHPHICTLYDVGPDYLVMEYVEGETIQNRIKKGALPLPLTLTYGIQIANALCEAHSKGITHRDLKPGNVMIAKNGVKVLDFGLAKFAAADETLTQAGVQVGTPLYMAPEQRDGRTADARTDIHALGLLRYEMATCKRALQGQPIQLQELPERFAHIVERCLAQEPEDRWQTARDLSAELAWATKRRSGSAPSEGLAACPSAVDCGSRGRRGGRRSHRGLGWEQ